MIPFPLEEAASLKPAWAAPATGILGQPAPELGLDTWIDSSGMAMPPVRLADQPVDPCGRLVYNDFHIGVDQENGLNHN